MSTDIVLELLRELGGAATNIELSRLARKRYPRASLHSYVGKRMRQLQRAGVVTRDEDEDRRWRLAQAAPREAE